MTNRKAPETASDTLGLFTVTRDEFDVNLGFSSRNYHTPFAVTGQRTPKICTECNLQHNGDCS